MRSAIRLMVGQALVSRVSAAAELVALNWWVFHATGSSAMVGAVTLARLVPLAVAGPWLGHVQIEWSRHGCWRRCCRWGP
ncbi:major facilitator transporter [Corynebacterium diphtheriae bv. mitis]|nr:hypothetical protein CIP107554_00539 [Corynebacterium diphtheriae]SUY73629.1 major facilitator transporter [Corynebacterium diphtheriae bv. mitis]